MKCQVTRTLNDEQETPLSYSDVYIQKQLIEGLHEEMIHTDVLINEFIAKQTGITAKEIRQTISAVTLQPVHAAYFNLPAGSLALEIKRQHFNEVDKVYHIGISVIPADRFHYETVLTRRASA